MVTLSSWFTKMQVWLKTLIRGSGFIFECVNLLYYKFPIVNPNWGELYLDSLHRNKDKKPRIYLINKKDNKSYQYVSLNWHIYRLM